jgi:hypothetical protein
VYICVYYVHMIKIQLLRMHVLYNLLFHIPLDWQSNSFGVAFCPFGTIYVGLHNGLAIVLGSEGFEQLAYLPFKVHLISKLFDSRGGHISINI